MTPLSADGQSGHLQQPPTGCPAEHVVEHRIGDGGAGTAASRQRPEADEHLRDNAHESVVGPTPIV